MDTSTKGEDESVERDVRRASAHELRSPLQTIVLSAAVLQERLAAELRTEHQALERLLAAAHRMALLISALER